MEYKLGDLLVLITKGTTPTTVGMKFTTHGVNYIKSECITYDGKIDKSKLVFINTGTHQKLKRSQLQVDDLLFSMAGIYLGKTARVTSDIIPANTNQALAIIRLNQQIAMPKYINYQLKQPHIIDFINNMSGQSAQPNINFEEIKSIPINLPPLQEQKAIASVLSSLDDKIDLLHRQNQTLEAMAETLFRQWFVEEAGEDWEEMPLDEAADFLNGLACQKYPARPGQPSLPVIKIREMRTGITEASDTATADVPSKFVVNNGDILFSWSGSLDVIFWFGGQGVLNQHLFKVTSNRFSRWYCYLWLKHHLKDFQHTAAEKATTMGHIQRHHLSQALVLAPSEGELREMDEIMAHIFDKLFYNYTQIQTLTTLRDILLPKLMSGEVRVKLKIS